MFDRRLIDYLPSVLQKVMEFMAITGAQQPEIEAAWGALDLVMNNQFIDSATEDGVAVWEKELNITPLVTDTLEDRKQRIKAAWDYGVVYTYNWLVSWLKKTCGTETPPPILEGYVLHTTLPISSDYYSALDNMRRYLSANVLIDPVILMSEFSLHQYTGAAYRNSIVQEMQSDSFDDVNLLADENLVVLTEGPEKKVLYELIN